MVPKVFEPSKFFCISSFISQLDAAGKTVNISIYYIVHLMTQAEQSWPRGYKTFFILNSSEHEILNAHKYENIKKFSIFQAQISLECYFSCS